MSFFIFFARHLHGDFFVPDFLGHKGLTFFLLAFVFLCQGKKGAKNSKKKLVGAFGLREKWWVKWSRFPVIRGDNTKMFENKHLESQRYFVESSFWRKFVRFRQVGGKKSDSSVCFCLFFGFTKNHHVIKKHAVDNRYQIFLTVNQSQKFFLWKKIQKKSRLARNSCCSQQV